MTKNCCVAIVALAPFMIATLVIADWRAELRAQMNPQRCLFEVLDAQTSGVLIHSFGQRDVELLWDGAALHLYVDSDLVDDLDQWVEDDGAVVISFESHEGRGRFGSTGTMGLRN